MKLVVGAKSWQCAHSHTVGEEDLNARQDQHQSLSLFGLLYARGVVSLDPRIMSPEAGGTEGVAGSQSMSTALHRSPNKLWRSNSIFSYLIIRLGLNSDKCAKRWRYKYGARHTKKIRAVFFFWLINYHGETFINWFYANGKKIFISKTKNIDLKDCKRMGQQQTRFNTWKYWTLRKVRTEEVCFSFSLHFLHLIIAELSFFPHHLHSIKIFSCKS